MKVKTEILLVTVLSLFLASCAGLKREKNAVVETAEGKNSEENSIKSQQDIDVIYAQAASRLEEFIKEAKKSGEVPVRFLSSDLFIKATDASYRGDFKTSSFLYKYVMDINPEDEFVAKKYAIDLIRLGDLEKAQVVLEDILKKNKNSDSNLGLLLGGIYTAKDDTKSARNIYEKILKRDPKNEEACVFYAKSFAIEEKYKEAQGILKDCMQRSKKAAIFPYYIGKMLLTQQKKMEAIQYFQQALNVDPTYYQASLAMGLLKEEKEDFKGAAKIYISYLKKDEDNYTILTRLVQVLFAAGNFKEVIPYAEKIVSLDSTDVNMKVRLGILYTDSKRYEDAISVFKELLAIVPNSDKVLYYLGALHQQVQNLDSALEYYSQIPSESSLFFDGQVQMANILQAQIGQDNENGQDASKKLNILQEMLTKAKSDKSNQELVAELQFAWISTMEQVEEKEKVIFEMEEMLKLSNLKDNHLYYLAAVFEKYGEFKRSDEVIGKLIESNPDNAHALNFLGYSLVERGERLDYAFELLERANKLKPNDGYILDSLGWYHFKKGNIKKAFEYISQAYKLINDDSAIVKHMALVHQELKDYAKAKKTFKEALKICKEEEEKTEILQAIDWLEKKRLPASGK